MASSHHQLITCSSNGSRKLPKALRLFGKEADDRVDALEVKKEVVFLSLRTNALLLQGSKDKDEGDGAQEAAAGFTPEKIIWWQVCLRLQDNQIFAFASTCRLFREIQKETRPEITTTVQKYFRSMPVVTTEWLMWSFKQLKEDDMISTSGKETYARECLAAIACHNENQQAIELLKSLGCPFNEWCTQSAATKGNLALLKFLAGEGTCMAEGTCSGAAYGGHLQVLQWARSEGCPWDEETCALAAQKGHLMVLMWACSQGCPWGATLFRMASEAGELEIMQWLLTQGWNLEWETYWVAIRKAQFHVIEWLQRGGWEIVPGTLAYAAREGRLNVLRWLRVRNCPWDEDTCTGAAKGGHLEILKWLQSEGCPWDEDTCAGAAEGGHLDILRWLRSKGCPWDEFTCVRAAEGGHLEILKWLRSEGCPWDEDTCTGAVEGGHLDVLEHAIGEGCEWNIGKLLAVAARKGHVHILSWLESNGCLDVFESESIWGPAIEEGHLHVLDWMNSHRLFSDGEGDWMLEAAVECGSDRDVLDWLHKHFKLNFTRSFHRAAEVEKIEMIKWMISKGIIIENVGQYFKKGSIEACNYAAEEGDVKLLEFFTGRGLSWGMDTFFKAAQNGHLDCMKFMWAKEGKKRGRRFKKGKKKVKTLDKATKIAKQFGYDKMLVWLRGLT